MCVVGTKCICKSIAYTNFFLTHHDDIKISFYANPNKITSYRPTIIVRSNNSIIRGSSLQWKSISGRECVEVTVGSQFVRLRSKII